MEEVKNRFEDAWSADQLAGRLVLENRETPEKQVSLQDRLPVCV
jgi:hypothetical protein